MIIRIKLRGDFACSMTCSYSAVRMTTHSPNGEAQRELCEAILENAACEKEFELYFKYNKCQIFKSISILHHFFSFALNINRKYLFYLQFLTYIIMEMLVFRSQFAKPDILFVLTNHSKRAMRYVWGLEQILSDTIHSLLSQPSLYEVRCLKFVSRNAQYIDEKSIRRFNTQIRHI